MNFPSLAIQTHDGTLLANKVVADLIFPMAQLGLENHSKICRSALEICKDTDALRKFDTAKRSVRKPDARNADFFSKLSGYTINQLKNQALRFGLDVTAAETSKSSWGLKNLLPGQTTSVVDSREYEDIIHPDILSAPIVDICIVQSGEPIPDGFYRIYKTPGNRKATLNSGNGGNSIYLCIRKDLTGQFAPITNIIVIFPDRGEYVPPGYHLVQRGKNAACNVNAGTSADHIFIGFKRDFLGNPITDIQPIMIDKGEEVPKNYNMIEKTIFGSQANLNTGTGGAEIHLCYRQELTRIQCLLNDASVSDQERLRLARTHANSMDDASSNAGSEGPYTKGSESNNNSRVTSLNKRSRSRSPMRRDSATGHRATTPRLRPTSEGAHDFSEKGTPRNASSATTGTGGDNSAAGGVLDVTKSDSAVELLSPSGTSTGGGVAASVSNDQDLESELEAALDSYADFYDECADAREAELVTLQRMQVVVDSNGNLAVEVRRKTLIAILAAVYVRRGEIANAAINCLLRLIKDTDFFTEDFACIPLLGTITMLDLSIEAACDRFDSAPENEHAPILHFLKIVIKHSGAKLSGLSVQKVFRTLNYLCNCYATKSDWITGGMHMPCNDPSQEVTPYKVLKQLVCDAVAQAETVDIAHLLPETTHNDFFFEDDAWMRNATENYIDVRFIVEDLIDDVVDSVDTARICESTLQTLSKQAFSTGSTAFWQQINLNARKLFQDTALRSPFVTLCAICKQAWHNVRTNKKGDPIPRDLGSKLVALEAITEFCHSAGEKLRASKIMGYQIRRLVVPCILFNVSYALIDHRIFSKVLRIVTALWNKWRRHLRIEFAILCDQFIFKILQASVWQIRPVFQMQVIQEVINWFEQPHLLIEMFVNYDMDRKFVSHWNTFSYLVRSMCAIGRRVSVITNAWDWRPMSQGVEDARMAITVREVHLQALEEVSRMAKVVMDASGHAFLIIQDTSFRNRSLGLGGWVEDEATLLKKDEDAAALLQQQSAGATLGGAASTSSTSTPTHAAAASISKNGPSVRYRRAAHQESEKLIKEAIKIYTEKQSLKKAVQFLLARDFMPNTPQEVANFLRVYKNSFDPAAIGEFLGEGGTNPAEEEYWSQIRFRYTRAVPFVETDIEPALRLYLTGCGFRLPGEAQKINRFVEVFVKAFWQDNSGTQYCPFRHPDTIHLLSYAIIMLNTDLHRAHGGDGRKTKVKKMTKEEFINNLRGADQGQDIDRDTLVKIYDSIAAQPIELAVTTTTKDQDDVLMNGKDGKKPADDMLQQKLGATSVGGSGSGGGGGGGSGGGVGGSVSSVMASANPLTSAAHRNSVAADQMRLTEEKKFIREIGQNIRDSEDLLRSLAPFVYRFQITDVDTKISLDLVAYMFETVWFHFHTIVESVFQAQSTDISAKFAALDILCYTLTSAVFLDMKVEKMAFADLLQKFRKSCESIPHILTANRSVPDDSWYKDVEDATADTTLETTAKLHKLVVHIKDTMQEAVNYEITQQVAARFEKRAKVLEHNTFFVRQGDLHKVSRNGRPTMYRFFLFSDHLIYAHLGGIKKEYIVHEQLSLVAMSVHDLDTDTSYCSFHISHPTKSFTVIADSPGAKSSWIREITHAIANCKKREQASREGPANRRMSMYGRIEEQQSRLLLERETSLLHTASPDRERDLKRHGRHQGRRKKTFSTDSGASGGDAQGNSNSNSKNGSNKPSASSQQHQHNESTESLMHDAEDLYDDGEYLDYEDYEGEEEEGGVRQYREQDDDEDVQSVQSAVPFSQPPTPVHGINSHPTSAQNSDSKKALLQSHAPPDKERQRPPHVTFQSLAQDGDSDEDTEAIATGILPDHSTRQLGVGIADLQVNDGSTNANEAATTQLLLPTPEERAQKQQEKVQSFGAVLAQLDEKSLGNLYNAVS